jgi:hypothetical protein
MPFASRSELFATPMNVSFPPPEAVIQELTSRQPAI